MTIDIPQDELRAGEAAALVASTSPPSSHLSASDTLTSASHALKQEQQQQSRGLAIDIDTSPSAVDIHLQAIAAATARSGPVSPPMSPRHDPQLGGYPPDCGSRDLKYLSYAKVLHDRGQTHPMRYSTTEFDLLGNPKPQKYPLSTDFGAHSFHRLPTDSFVLSQYGVGMTLYFKYLKVMTWLFFLLVVLSAPALVIYIVGGKGSLAEFQVLAKQNLPMILGMTSIGHLRESSSLCDQVAEGNTLSLVCPAGEIGFVKAVYSTQGVQGTCGCPEGNTVATGSGKCRGMPERTCSGSSCTQICPTDGYGCFLGTHPVSKWPCCAKALDTATSEPNFDDMRIRSTPGCGSSAVQTIANGLCLGQKSCTMDVSEDVVYEWKVTDGYETQCLDGESTPGAICTASINDKSDYSQCGNDTTTKRSLIVYARCFTTRIDLSNEWSLKIVGWDSISVCGAVSICISPSVVGDQHLLSRCVRERRLTTLTLTLSSQRQDFLGLAVGCDITCSLCFFFIVIWMKRKERESVERITKDQIKALDYTVQLVHLPRHKDVGKLREEVRSPLCCCTTPSTFALCSRSCGCLARSARTWRRS